MKKNFKKALMAMVIMFFVNSALVAQATQVEYKQIEGKVLFDKAPLADVNIKVLNTTRGTKTDKYGNYDLKAAVGEAIQFSYVGLKTVTIIVEDVTIELNVTLRENPNQLKEATVIARKKVDPIEEFIQRANVNLQGPTGIFNPYRSGFATAHIPSENLNLGAPNLAAALSGKASGLRSAGFPPVLLIRDQPATYILNGISYPEPPISMMNIKDVFILKRTAQVFIVPDDAPHIKKIETEKIAEKYRNQNYYQDDAVALNDSQDETDVISIQEKEIFGKITTNDAPLENANIRIVGSAKGTSTDAKGNYRLKVSVGDEVEYSHVGMHKVGVIIEDITSEVNIDMVSLKNSLDEVLIIAKNSKGEVIKRSEKAESAFKTSRGTIDPKRVGYAVGYIDGQKIDFALYPTLRAALLGKVSGLSINASNGKVYMRGANSSVLQDYPVAWEVDGNFTSEEPIGINLNEIKDIRLLRGLAATNKYGTLGAGGVIVVTTTMGELSSNNRISGIREEFTNQNYYQNDAVSLEDNIVSGNHVNALKEYTNRALAYKFYDEQMAEALPSYQYHIDIAQTFNSYFKDSFRASEVLMNVAKKHNRNPEILKAVAFNLQAINAPRQAVTIYQQLLSLRPTYGQSYRDLANALKENNQFKKSWRYYMNYLLIGNNLEGEGIGQTIYNEMEYLYFNRANQTQIEQQFTPRSRNKVEFRNDVRFVAEWNTSEAEFDLEFVGPDKRAYTFEHTLVANQELITDEKKTGYSSKEFIIDDVGTGEWLVNIIYYGNKKSAPTYFKLSTYYNWGSPQQREEVQVFRLDIEDQKFQILKINEQSLVATN